LREDAARSVTWSIVEKWGARATTLVVLVVLGRLLSPADFGLVALATTVLALATVFVDSGFGRALIQRETITDEHRNTAFWTSIFIGAVLAGAIALGSGAIENLFRAPGLGAIAMWLGLTLLINSLAVTQASLMERSFRFKALALRRLTATLFGGIAAITAALSGMGVWSLVLQSVVSALVGAIALWAVTDWRPAFSFSRHAFRDLWRVGISIVGIELVGYLNSQADRIVIGLYLSVQALGYYYMAMSIIAILIELFSSVFSNVSLAAFSRLQGTPDRLRMWFYKLTRITASAAVPIFGLTAVLAPQMIPLVLGPQWSPAVPILQVLTLLGALNSILYFDRSVLIATGHALSGLYLTLGQAVFGVALVLIGVQWGILGITFAVVARQYLYWPVRMAVLKTHIGLHIPRYLAAWAVPFLVTLTAVGAALVIAVFLPPHDGSLWLTTALQLVVVAFILAVGAFTLARSTLREMIAFLKSRAV
jgi:O-antigen/teichoic acid export membrane protein